jgi:hypothetical protein
MSGALRDNNELNILTTANNANIVFTPNGTGQVQVDSGLVVNNSISSATTISAVGNIVTSGFFVGDFVGNIVANITNIPGPAGAVVYNNGSGNAAATAGLVYTTGPNALTILGNLVSDFVIANGIQGPLTTASQPNITGVGTLTTLSVSGNINLGGALRDSGQLDIQTTAGNANINLTPNGTGIVQVASALSVTGNLIAPNLVGAGAGTPTISSTSNLVLSAAGAVQVTGALTASSTISAVGNISGNYFIGNGSLLTGIGGGSSYTNANVVSLMAAFGSNVISTTGNVTATTFVGNLVGAGAGVPSITSTGNLVLSAVGQVQVTGNLTATNITGSGVGTFRLPNLTAGQIANLTAANGDLIYNTTVNKIQGYENGAWGNLI